jgi:hypothetical protein
MEQSQMMLRLFYDYVFDFYLIFYLLLLEDLLREYYSFVEQINLKILNELIVEDDQFDVLMMIEINNLLLPMMEMDMMEKKIMKLLKNYYLFH